MPGPVSDSFDPEFGTSANADEVREALAAQVTRIAECLGPQRMALKNIVEVVLGEGGPQLSPLTLTEQEARIIRFALNRAIDSM